MIGKILGGSLSPNDSVCMMDIFHGCNEDEYASSMMDKQPFTKSMSSEIKQAQYAVSECRYLSNETIK